MIEFKAPAADAPELALSPLHRAAMLTLHHLVEAGPIGLTPNRALKRYFVTWAAEAFNWPGYTTDKLYVINKVLNEQDFPPLAILHDLLLAAKLARHRKGFLHITKIGKDLLEHPASLWISLSQHLLLSAGHDDMLEIEWVSILNAVPANGSMWWMRKATKLNSPMTYLIGWLTGIFPTRLRLWPSTILCLPWLYLPHRRRTWQIMNNMGMTSTAIVHLYGSVTAGSSVTVTTH